MWNEIWGGYQWRKINHGGKISICGKDLQEDANRVDVPKILSNISENMEDREKSKKIANENKILVS